VGAFRERAGVWRFGQWQGALFGGRERGSGGSERGRECGRGRSRSERASVFRTGGGGGRDASATLVQTNNWLQT
jgi:hypothetical protein